MRNDSFWDVCKNNSIRHIIAEFIVHSPLLQHFKGEKYFELEDALAQFIEQNRDIIYRETSQEYFREDVYRKFVDYCGEDAKLFVKNLPIEKLDFLIDEWKSELDESDLFWEYYWDPLIKILKEYGFTLDFKRYKQEEIQLYMLYLNDWFKNHDIENMRPACIDEFLSNEMQETDNAKYYKNLLKKESENL